MNKNKVLRLNEERTFKEGFMLGVKFSLRTLGMDIDEDAAELLFKAAQEGIEAIDEESNSENRLDKAVEFLKERSLLSWQWFDSRNLVGDYMETIYDADGITIDVCYGYRYIEIFGLTPEETERFGELSTFKY